MPDRETHKQPLRQTERSRSDLPGLLARPPDCGRSRSDWAGWVIDPIKQIEALEALVDRGLLSGEEFERQKAKVLQR